MNATDRNQARTPRTILTSRAALTGALAVIVVAVTLLSFLSAAGVGRTAVLNAPSSPLTPAGPALPPPTAVPSVAELPSPAAAAAAPSLPGLSLGHFTLPGPHPSAWGPAGIPPGAEAAVPRQSVTPPTQSSSNWDNRFCAGLWPGGPADWAQSYYAPGCYGHDEPGIQFYSNLAGSGGNVSWNISLPVDRSATHNQSNLYSAIWFGMTLTDRLGWMGQCFLELQFYPDQTWYNPGTLFPNDTVNGQWIAAAVAWQIESATGAEDPCFYEPAYANGVPGPAFLNMTQGDNIQITMSGWGTNPNGEGIQIVDVTNGQKSNFTLFDSAGGYPLNPAYSTNAYPNSLQWTPGGEYPVSFAFETGHAGNPDWPSNNSYGGCSGGPTSTPTDPGAPCPSYDGGQWANDTLHPWHIGVPTFWNAHATVQASQVAFTQPEGGINLVDQTSNGVCSGSEGSAWCTYPWYSYYCDAQAFEFGALDYAHVTADFGQYHQFNTQAIADASGIGFFGPTNFSIPTCAHPAYSVSIAASGAGSVDFLSTAYSGTASVGGLGAGVYSISALPGAGLNFGSWTTTGGVHVTDPLSPWATLAVSGSGSVTAVFSTSPATTTVTFTDQHGGQVGVNPTPFFSGTGAGLATLNNGGSLTLAAGIYPVEAYPKIGYEFSSWSVIGSGVTIAAPQFPITWMLLDGTASTAKVVAHFVASSDNATVYLAVEGGVGSAKLGGLTVTNTVPGGFVYNVATYSVGTYSLDVSPGPHTFQSEIGYYFPVIAMMNFSAHTRATLENGTSEFLIDFVSSATPTLQAGSAGGGRIMMSSGTGFTTVASGTTESLPAGTYTFVASPSAYHAFSMWTTNNPTDATFLTSATSPLLEVTLSGPSVITAHFAFVSGTSKVTLGATTGSGGILSFNFGPSHTNGGWVKVANGEYLVTESASPGWQLLGWGASGGVSVLTVSGNWALVSVTGNGSLGASYSLESFLVSFVAYAGGVHVSNAHVLIDSTTTLTTGGTTVLSYGSHTLVITVGPGHGVTWESSANIGVPTGTHTLTISFFVSGAGTIYAVVS